MRSPAVILYDASGNAVGVVLDGAVYRLQTSAAIEKWLGSTAPTVGQKVAASSLPVVVASDQSAIPVSDGGGSLTTDTPQLPAALVGGRLDENLGAWLGSTAPTVGQKTLVASVPVALASDQTVIPVSDNGGSLTTDTPQLPAALVGGRLDENLGAWLGSTAPTVGQKAMAASVPVVLASNQAAIPTTATPVATSASAVTSVASSAVTTTLLAANAARLGAVVYNDSTKILYLKLGAGATVASYTMQVFPDGSYEIPFSYTGIITGIWDSANGAALVTELTA